MSLSVHIKKVLSFVLAPFYKGAGHILMLHRVVPDSSEPRVHNPVNEISIKGLEELILFYREQKIDIISLDQIQDYINRKRYFVVFTFDDGYKDNLTEALPVFEKHQAPFTIYLTTGFPDHQVIIWWYLLEEVLLQNTGIEVFWNDTKHHFACTSKQEKEVVFNDIRRMIIDTPPFRQQELLKKAFRKYVPDPLAITRELALSWAEVGQLANSPLVTIGAHTKHHLALNQLSNKELQDECIDSKTIIEKHINKKVSHFAYPFGSIREVGKREMDYVKELGFTTATTTRTGVIFPAHRNHLHALPRIGVNPNLTLVYLRSIISGVANAQTGLKKRVITV